MAVMGNKIPPYGSGGSLSSSTGMPKASLPLKLSFKIRSRATCLGDWSSPSSTSSAARREAATGTTS
ncbi:hypothetical protein SESBI_43712 [Sesbania bispinosa]|nr:hypothetical protein SESBI_43712 [Sesbania bispinosa]